MKMRKDIGQRIKAFRTQAGLNQKQLADKIGVTNRAVSNWEKGLNGVDVELLPAICEVLHVDLTDLLDTPKPPPPADILYVSRPSGDTSIDEHRKQLHEYIDSLPDDELRAMTIMFRIEKN